MKKYLYAGILIGTVMLAGCTENGETDKQGEVEKDLLADVQTLEVDTISNSDKNIVDSAIPLKLTQEQKEEYHKQYVEIVEKVNQKKLGLVLGVPPIESFKEEDWKEPKAYEQMVQMHEDSFLATEREKLAAVSTDLKPAEMDPDGKTTKATYLYFPDLLTTVEVKAKFDTQLNEDKSRQLFSKVDEISTKIISSHGTWEQTFQKATLQDGGQTYLIYIEGILDLNNTTTEKTFTIEFHCDEFGNIS